MSGGEDELRIMHAWTTRKIPPIILLGVIGVFVGYMLLAHFVFHSIEGVKALLLGSVGVVAPLVPAILQRVEYRITDRGLQKRPFRRVRPGEFEDVFRWEELDCLESTRHGFRYHRPFEATGGFRSFWRRHVSDAYSGEFRAQEEDRRQILEIAGQRGIAVRGRS